MSRLEFASDLSPRFRKGSVARQQDACKPPLAARGSIVVRQQGYDDLKLAVIEPTARDPGQSSGVDQPK
jgi:hypothetical protein